MMEVRRFHSEDMTILNQWRIKRDMRSLELIDMPSSGVVVFEDHVLVAMGFIRKAEGLAIVDSLITNPECPPKQRYEAMDLVFTQLIEFAKFLGIDKLVGFSIDSNTLKRAERFGFKKPEHQLMVLHMEKK